LKTLSDNDLNVLLIGQGYAGSLLAWMLISKGINLTVVDSGTEFSSTKVAAGIMLPVTGRRLAKTHLADRIIPFAKQTYREIGNSTGKSFFVEKDVLQIFASVSNLNEWYARSAEDEMQNYCGDILTKERVPETLQNEFGGIILKQSGYVEPGAFLSGMQELIQEKGQYISTAFNFEDLSILPDGLSWNDKKYSHIIFCEGYHTKQNPYFGYLPFKPAKGEILDFTSEELNDDYIVSNGVYILPLGNSRFRTGATYTWDDLTETPTEAGLNFLTDNLKKTVRCNFEITGHKAGIRPAIRDRRPLVGFHPVHSQLGIFNGLGTKGAMLGPYYANQMVDMLLENKQPDRDVAVSRFDSLCQVK